MANRVGIVLSGCGAQDGSEIREAMFTLLAVERAGGRGVFAAPDVQQPRVIDHRNREPIAGAPPRNALVESARIARGEILDLAALKVGDVDMLIFPGGQGVASVLSNYVEKGVLCEVHPEVVRLLKGNLSTHRPLGFICLAPLLAARVLGPVAGVRLTLGARGSIADKHAAIMGADVRPCAVRDIVVDEKARVVSTPAYMYDDAQVIDVAAAIDKLVRTLFSLARDRRPAQPQPRPGQQAQRPAGNQGQRPAGANQGQRPAGGNQGQRPAGANQGQRPAANQGQRLAANQDQRPAGGNKGRRPAGGNQGQQPAGNQGQQAAGNQGRRPAGGNQGQRPADRAAGPAAAASETGYVTRRPGATRDRGSA